MPKRPPIKPAIDWSAKAVAEMRSLGLDPASHDHCRRFATDLFRTLSLRGSIPKPGDDKTIESAATHKMLFPLARIFSLVADLRREEKTYRSRKSPSQRDVLDSAVQVLKSLSDHLSPLRISPFGGLRNSARILLPELLNVTDNRLSRLLSPSNSVVVAARAVTDSGKDRIRVTISGLRGGCCSSAD